MEIRVTKLRQDTDGLWRCNVSANGTTIAARRFGGWQTEPGEGGHSRSLLPAVAAVIQSRLPATEQTWKVKR